MKTNQINRLAILLGMSGLNGTAAIASSAGLFRLENVFLIAVLLIAGPGAILTAVLFQGAIKERMFTALLAGIIATIIIVLAAGLGPRLLSFFNINMIKIFGGIALFAIGLIIMGIKIPESIPLMIILAGVIIGVVWRQ